MRSWGGWIVVGALALAGCTPVTGRNTQRWESGQWSLADSTASVASVPELVEHSKALPGTQRSVVENALAAIDAVDPGLDCSSFVQRVYAVAGVPVPRTVREQLAAGTPVTGEPLRPGDLVFFAFSRRPADHVGIYTGRGRIVHVSA